jgi:predicted nuclease of restriction endonuclease-like (RecB) superfamily
MNNQITAKNYEKLLSDIRSLLEEGRKKAVTQINNIIVNTYWSVGKQIVEFEQKGNARAEYGQNILEKLSIDLTKHHGPGFNLTNLKYMRQFYSIYRKSHALRDKLSWTHYRTLIKLDSNEKRVFYENECINGRWSSRELERQINSMLYERVSLSRKKQDVISDSSKKQIILKPEDEIKDPYILEFLGLKDVYHETDLEEAIINNIEDFLLELGSGFAFIGRQHRLQIGNNNYYIDLVFYHRILRCFVLIDLKIGEFSHQDAGQMNFYLNYIRDNEMFEGENQPIGIILCADKDESQVKYALGGLSNKIFASKYKLRLPSEEELKKELESESRRLLSRG